MQITHVWEVKRSWITPVVLIADMSNEHIIGYDAEISN